MKISLIYDKVVQPTKPTHLFGDVSQFEVVCPKDIDGIRTLPQEKANLYWVSFTKGDFESQWFKVQEGFTDLSNEVLKYRKQETIDDI